MGVTAQRFTQDEIMSFEDEHLETLELQESVLESVLEVMRVSATADGPTEIASPVSSTAAAIAASNACETLLKVSMSFVVDVPS